MNDEVWCLLIEWLPSADPSLPRNIGPFASKDEADKWARLNVPNGLWESYPLAYPYRRAEVETP